MEYRSIDCGLDHMIAVVHFGGGMHIHGLWNVRPINFGWDLVL